MASAAVHRVIDALQAHGCAPKRQGAGWRAKCPAHDDSRPSLDVDEGRDGAVLITCRSGGCEASVIVSALGLELSDLFPSTGSGPAARWGQADADLGLERRGLRLETIERFGVEADLGKQAWRFQVGTGARFKRFQPGEPKSWWSGKKPASGADVYGLDHVDPESSWLLLVEGEPDVWIGHQAGLPAVSFTGGATTVPQSGVRALAEDGRPVTVLYDADDAGRAGAIKAAEALQEAGVEVVVRRHVGLPPGGDLTTLYGDLDRDDAALRERVATLPVDDGSDAEDPEAESDGLPRSIPAIEARADSMPDFDFEGFAVQNEIHVLASDGGVGRTTVLVCTLAAQAAGCSAVDRFPNRRPGPVLLVSEEDSEGLLRNRLEALAVGHGWPIEDVLERVHLLCLAEVRINHAVWQQHLLDEVERIGAVAVGLDPWFELIDGDENSNSDVRPAIQFCRRLAQRATVYISTHAGKAVEGKRKIDRIRGASALYSAARVVYFLERDERGIAVHPLKFSRGELPQRYFVGRTIEVDTENKALWTTARLKYLTPEAAQEQGAEKLVRDALAVSPGMTSGSLKNHAKGTGITAIELSKAIKDLETLGVITHEPGPRNSKHWKLASTLPQHKNADPAGQGGQGQKTTLPSDFDPAGQGRPASSEPALPLRGQAEGKASENGSAGSPREMLPPPTLCAAGCGRSVGRPGITCATCRYGSSGSSPEEALSP